MTACLKCKLPLLPAVEDDEEDGDLFWCPRCDAYYEKTEKQAPLYRQPGPPRSDLAKATSLVWKGHLELDGAVTFKFLSGTGTPSEIRRAATALSHLAMLGEQRQRHLRGADRWAFRRGDGGAFFARILDQEAELVPWRCAGRRSDDRGRVLSPETCDACKTALVKGTIGYRPKDRSSDGLATSVSWGGVRFCARCVEAAPAATARGVLRVIDGGAAVAKGAQR